MPGICATWRPISTCCAATMQAGRRSNSRRDAADAKFLAREGAVNFYTLYRCHNCHFIIYGRCSSASIELRSPLPTRLGCADPRGSAAGRIAADGRLARRFRRQMKTHVLIRFGKWGEIIAAPLPRDRALTARRPRCSTMPRPSRMRRPETYQGSGRREERSQIEAALARVPPSRYVFNNTCLDILTIAAGNDEGRGRIPEGQLRPSLCAPPRRGRTRRQSPYDEPWGLDAADATCAGRPSTRAMPLEEAEEVYRADLGLDETMPRACLHPENLWSLHGLHECLMRTGRTMRQGRIMKQRLDLAAALSRRADQGLKRSAGCGKPPNRPARVRQPPRRSSGTMRLHNGPSVPRGADQGRVRKFMFEDRGEKIAIIGGDRVGQALA